MSLNSEQLRRGLRELSGLRGDLAAGFRAVVSWLNTLLPSCHHALVLNRPVPRLAALARADGQIVIELTDATDAQGGLLRLDDLLAQHLLSLCTPAWLTPSHVELGSASARLLGYPQRVLRIPVYTDGVISHVWLLAFAEALETCPLELDSGVLLINAAVALTRGNVRAGELHQQNQQVLAEFSDLVEVQRALLPDEVQFIGLEHAIHYQPSAKAGGDYYDLNRLNHYAESKPSLSADVVGCVIADVSGHGAGAAMETVQFDAILRTYKGEGDGPAGAMDYANRHFFSRRPRGHFMTVLALLLNPHAGLVRFCSAGHPPFLRLSAGQVTEHGRSLDIPLGILREVVYSNHELPWVAGDVYLLLTDGIFEARDAQGREFGMQRVIELLLEHADDSADSICKALVQALHSHQGGPVGRDDQTFLVLRLQEPQNLRVNPTQD